MPPPNPAVAARAPVPAHWDASRLALLALTGLALYLCWLMARPFVTSLAWATALAVAAWPLHRRLAAQVRPKGVAALLTTSAVLLLITVPTSALAPRLVSQTGAGLTAIREWLSSGGIQQTLDRAPWWMQPGFRWAEGNIDAGELAQRAGDLLAGMGTIAVKASFDGVVQLFLTFFLLYYFLRDRDLILRRGASLLPLTRAEARLLFRSIGDTLYATLLGKVLVSAMQGVLVGAMFAWLGVTAPWFWGTVTGVVALVPVLGPPVVWVPAAVFLALDGRWGAAMGLTVWGAAVVGLADNLVYPAMVGNRVRLHTVPMLLSMIGGLFVFGLVGFFLGPVVLSATLTLLRIWRGRERMRHPGTAAPGAGTSTDERIPPTQDRVRDPLTFEPLEPEPMPSARAGVAPDALRERHTAPAAPR
jgi:predicted PurR-regulated permease PerM